MLHYQAFDNASVWRQWYIWDISYYCHSNQSVVFVVGWPLMVLTTDSKLWYSCGCHNNIISSHSGPSKPQCWLQAWCYCNIVMACCSCWRIACVPYIFALSRPSSRTDFICTRFNWLFHTNSDLLSCCHFWLFILAVRHDRHIS